MMLQLIAQSTVLLRGNLRVESADHSVRDVRSGQGIITRAGEWARYSTHEPEDAEYIAVCVPARCRV
jgi:hypothetical protein